MEKELNNKYKILVVDDEEDICEILKFNLEIAGYHVETAANAEEALHELCNGYHLILLDIMMEGMSGLNMVQMLRDNYNSDIPVIFLSALDSEADILNGFDKGGDDYIPKPFSMKEVLARVNAVLQRCYAGKKNLPAGKETGSDENGSGLFDKNLSDKYINNKFTINYSDKRVYIENTEILLTKKEYEILVLLTKNPNKIYSREDILNLVWKNESYVLDRTVDVHIARLRKKLGNYGNLIINRSGYGYCFQPKY